MVSPCKQAPSAFKASGQGLQNRIVKNIDQHGIVFSHFCQCSGKRILHIKILPANKKKKDADCQKNGSGILFLGSQDISLFQPLLLHNSHIPENRKSTQQKSHFLPVQEAKKSLLSGAKPAAQPEKGKSAVQKVPCIINVTVFFSHKKQGIASLYETSRQQNRNRQVSQFSQSQMFYNKSNYKHIEKCLQIPQVRRKRGKIPQNKILRNSFLKPCKQCFFYIFSFLNCQKDFP